MSQIQVVNFDQEINPKTSDIMYLLSNQGGGVFISRKVSVSDLADVINVAAPLKEDFATINVVIGTGVTVITTGIKGFLEIPYNCEIRRATLLADRTGSIVVDIWRDTYAAAPPTVLDSITAAAKPTIASGIKSQDEVLSGWLKTLTAGDILGFNVDSVSSIMQATLSLLVRRT